MKNRPDMGLAGFEKGADYFLALQVGQVAQVDLLSVQHFMPQDAAAFSDLHLLQAQPAHKCGAFFLETVHADYLGELDGD